MGKKGVSSSEADQHLGHEIQAIFDMGVSRNSGTPKSSILIRFSIINHPFWGIPIFGNTHIQHSLNHLNRKE